MPSIKLNVVENTGGLNPIEEEVPQASESRQITAPREAQQEPRRVPTDYVDTPEQVYTDPAFKDGLFDVTPEQESRWKAMGEITWQEEAGRVNISGYMGNLLSLGTKNLYDQWQTKKVFDRIADNAYGSEEEKSDDYEKATDFFMAMEERRARGTSVGAGIFSGVSFLPEAALGFLTSGGLVAGGKLVMKKGMMEVLKGVGKRGVVSSIGKAVSVGGAMGKGASWGALGAQALGRTAFSPIAIKRAHLENQQYGRIVPTEKGLKIMKESKTPALDLVKAVASTYTENFSELLGFKLDIGLEKIGSVLAKKAFLKPFVKMVNGMKFEGKTAKFFDAISFNNPLTEVLEERAKATFDSISGISYDPDGNESYFEHAMKSTFPSWKQLAVEAGVSLSGASMGSVISGIESRIKYKGSQEAQDQAVELVLEAMGGPSVALDTELRNAERAHLENELVELDNSKEQYEDDLDMLKAIEVEEKSIHKRLGQLKTPTMKADDIESKFKNFLKVNEKELAEHQELIQQEEVFRAEEAEARASNLPLPKRPKALQNAITEGLLKEAYGKSKRDIVDATKEISNIEKAIKAVGRTREVRSIEKKLAGIESNIAQADRAMETGSFTSVNLEQSMIGADILRGKLAVAKGVSGQSMKMITRLTKKLGEAQTKLLEAQTRPDILNDLPDVVALNVEASEKMLNDMMNQSLVEAKQLAKKAMKEGSKTALDSIRKTQDALFSVLQNSLNLNKKDSAAIIGARKALGRLETLPQLINQLPKIYEDVKAAKERRTRKVLDVAIRDVLDKTKPISRSGKTVTKGLTVEANKLYAQVRAVLKMSKGKAREALDSFSGKGVENFDSHIVKEALTYVASGSKADLGRSIGLLKSLTGSYHSNRGLFETKKLQEREKAKREIAEMLVEVAGSTLKLDKKIVNDKAKTLADAVHAGTQPKGLVASIASNAFTNTFLGYHSLMNTLALRSGKKIGKALFEKKTDIFHAERDEINLKMNATAKQMQIAQDAYGRGAREILEENAVSKPVFYYDDAGKQQQITMSVNQAITVYMQTKQSGFLHSLEDQYGENFLDFVENTMLTEADRSYGDQLIGAYQDWVAEVSRVTEAMTGVPFLPGNMYSPGRRVFDEDGSLSPVQDYIDVMRKSQDFQSKNAEFRSNKNRMDSDKGMLLEDVNQVYSEYVQGMSHYIAWSEKIKELQGVFNDKKIRAAVSKMHGDNFMKGIDAQVQTMIDGGKRNMAEFEKASDWISAAALNQVTASTKIGVNQLTSAITFSNEMNPVKWAFSFMKELPNFYKNAKFLYNNSIVFKHRWDSGQGGLLDTEKRGPHEDIGFKNQNDIGKVLTIFNRMGDIGAIYAGAYPLYLEVKEKTGSHEQAIEAIERHTIKTQQSAAKSHVNAYQRSKGNVFSDLATKFTSTPYALTQASLNAARESFAGKGRMHPMRAMQAFTTLWVALPLMYQYVTSLGDMGEEDVYASLILGPVGSIPIVNLTVGNLVRKALGADHFWGQDIISSAFNMASKGVESLREEEWEEALRDFGQSLSVMGAKVLPKGVNPRRLMDVGKGLYDLNKEIYSPIFSGDDLDFDAALHALARATGFTPERVDKRLGY